MIELDKIYNEDCLIGMQRIPDGSVDAIICDLPYGTTKNKWDSIIPLDDLWTQYKRIIKPNGAIVLFSQQPFTSILVASNYDWFKYEWIWQKEAGTGHLNAKRAPLKIHENICVFYKQQPTYNPQMRKGKPYFCRSGKASANYGEQVSVQTICTGERYPVDVVSFSRDKSEGHPTQKPVDLIRYLVRTYSDMGGVILDNCMGSGTTAIACMREKRNYIGFELNREYWQKANDRIEKERQQLTFDF